MEYRSDNRQENHPKPVQEGERKLVNGNYVDWATIAEVIANTNQNYRRNKYYWVAGTRYHVDDDGTTFRSAGGGGTPAGEGLKVLLFIVGTGTPTAAFDGYIPAGNTLTDARLYGARIVSVYVDGTTYDSFNTTKAFYVPKFDLPPDSAYLDFSRVGGIYDGQSIIITYQ